MIIETPFKDGDTVTVKTTAGEEIVARLVQIQSDSYKLAKPMKIVATQQGIGLMPLAYTIHPDSKVEIHKHAILFIAKTDSEMSKQYIGSTSGILV